MNPFEFIGEFGAMLNAWLEELESKDPSFALRTELDRLESELKALKLKQRELKDLLLKDYQTLDELAEKVAKFRLRAELARRYNRGELADKAETLISQLRAKGQHLFSGWKEKDCLYVENRKQILATQTKIALVRERLESTTHSAQNTNVGKTSHESSYDEMQLNEQFKKLEAELELEALKNRTRR